MGAFKTYDIRGIYGREVDNDLAARVGRAFARHAGLASCIVAYDAREHSADLCDRLIEGLRSEGVSVVTLGLTSTPHLHYAQIAGGYPGAVMVTASHNPPRYHGFKLFGAGGGSISYDTGLAEVERIAGALPPPAGEAAPGGQSRRGTLERAADAGAAGAAGPYIEFLASAAAPGVERLRVIVDASNGSAGAVFRSLGNRLGLRCGVINGTPDGFFPNHGPNPLEPASREQVAAEVRRSGADVGAIIDGDGDRVIFVDETGRAIENYFASALIAEHLLAASSGGAVVYDLISSRVLPERIAGAGGKPVISRVGYTFIHRAMVANDALFGTETSGHAYFRTADGHITESAAYGLVIVLNLLAARGRPLSELVKPLRERYAQAPEINIEVEDRDAAMRLVEEKHRAAIADRLDGLSVSYPDYWFNVRPSNTEPILRVRLEATSAEVAERRAAELRALLGA
jgi:phosphomannomutase